MDTFVSIYHDTRVKKDNGLYPVKLRIHSSYFRKAKLYSLNIHLTKEDFQKSWLVKNPTKKYLSVHHKLQFIQEKATRIVDELQNFTYESFEKMMFRRSGDGTNVKYHFESLINEFKHNEQFSTRDLYELTLKSFDKFLKYQGAGSIDTLTFMEINPSWLKEYEKYMLKHLKRSRTTLSMYLRNLRAVFNKAIDESEVDRELYPFGRRKYTLPNVKNVKKSLSKAQLKTFFEAEPTTPDQEKAKAFWFLSYSCNGMNIKDIAMLKWKDIKEDKIIFIREKTKNTSKGNLKPVIVYLTDYAQSVIDKYGSKTNKNGYIFSIVDPTASAIENRDRIKNFTRFINQHVKKMAATFSLPNDISTYWARHSFATNAIRSGASMEFVSEALNHSSLKTTQNYFAGFEEEKKKEIIQKLMEF